MKHRRRFRGAKSAAREVKIDAVCGRYAKVPSSSQRFAADKKREIQREARAR
jgi:hypothetical protein